MAEERQILLEIEVDKKGAQNQLEENAELLELNKAELANLNKAYKAGELDVADYAKAKLQLTQKNKELGAENRNLIKTLGTENNSLNALRANLSKLTAERNNTNQATKEGKERFQALQKQILSTTDAIKGQEEAGGDFRRSVGNYGKALTSNIPLLDGYVAKLTEFKAGLIATKNGLGLTTKGLGGTSKALKLFKIALISTGIGAIVVVVGSLIAAFASTQKGIDTVTKVTRPLQQIFQRFIGVVQNLGLALLNPVKAFEDLKDIITGFISDPVGSIKAAAKGVVEFTKNAIDAGTRIDQLTKSIELQNIALVKLEGTNNRIFEQEKEIAENQENAIEKRIAAARKALRATTELEEGRIAQLNRIIELKKLENEANDTGNDALLELAELEAQRDEAAAAAAGKRTGVQNLLNTLLKEQNKTLQEEQELIRLQQEQSEIAQLGSLKRIEAKKLEVDAIKELTFDSQQAQIDAQRTITESQREQARIRQEIQQLENEFTLAASANLAGSLSSLFDQGTAAYKSFAITEALISTYLAITNTLGAFSKVPIPGYAFIQAAAIGVAGFANVANIASTGKGGGGGSANSKTTSAPRGGRTTLSGAFDRNQLTSQSNNAQADRNNVSNSINNLPTPIVKVSDINKVQNQKSQIKVSSSL